MKHLATIVLSLALSPLAVAERAQAPNPLPQFVDMFNGKDLTGWVNINTAEDTWKVRDGMVIAVATEGDKEVGEKADHTIYIPSADPLVNPILTTIPLQLFAYHVALLRGCDVDKPRNLAKSVTVE